MLSHRSLFFYSTNILKKTEGLKQAEKYALEYWGYCIPNVLNSPPNGIEIGPTGIIPKQDKLQDKLLEFAKDGELKKKYGEEMLEATRNTFQELKFFSPEKISDIYYPHDEVTSQLLLKLSGYSFSEWEKMNNKVRKLKLTQLNELESRDLLDLACHFGLNLTNVAKELEPGKFQLQNKEMLLTLLKDRIRDDRLEESIGISKITLLVAVIAAIAAIVGATATFKSQPYSPPIVIEQSKTQN